MGSKLANSVEHMGGENRNQSFEGRGVCALDMEVQLQQNEAFSPWYKLLAVVTLPIPWSHLCATKPGRPSNVQNFNDYVEI